LRYKIILSYDGTQFYGWQRQKDKPTVQKAAEDALHKIYGRAVSVTGSGRTDEGVHAYGQAAHFDAPDRIEPQKLVSALNFYLPQTVRVLMCEPAPDGFHARKSAQRKTYCYDMYYGTENPFLYGRALRLPDAADKDKMKAAAGVFVGKFDFSAFRCKGSGVQTTVRTVFECAINELTLCQSPALRLRVSADGFLYKMARIIAGSLIRVGEGRLTADGLVALLLSGAEWPQKIPAEPGGLYLYSVEY